MKTHQNLKFYVDKLKAGERFSLARYGDGELYCMWGKKGENSNGCRYSPELRQALLDSMHPREGFIHGLQRVLPEDESRIMKEYPNIEWYDTEIFSEAVAHGELFPLIERLREMKVLVVGNKNIRKVTKDLFSWEEFIEVPPSNAYDIRNIVMPHLEKTLCDVLLFSCGMAANVFISELHGKNDVWLIDVGHIWDPFAGNMSRCDLDGKTLDDIEKNLHDR